MLHSSRIFREILDMLLCMFVIFYCPASLYSIRWALLSALASVLPHTCRFHVPFVIRFSLWHFDSIICFNLMMGEIANDDQTKHDKLKKSKWERTKKIYGIKKIPFEEFDLTTVETEGGMGSVKKASWKTEDVALKIVNKTDERLKDSEKHFIYEVSKGLLWKNAFLWFHSDLHNNGCVFADHWSSDCIIAGF